MTIEQTINKAIEGGYDKYAAFIGGEFFIEIAVNHHQFWECLGKEMGWKKTYSGSLGQIKHEEDKIGLKEWHKFIDHLANGNIIESYFKTL